MSLEVMPDPHHLEVKPGYELPRRGSQLRQRAAQHIQVSADRSLEDPSEALKAATATPAPAPGESPGRFAKVNSPTNLSTDPLLLLI